MHKPCWSCKLARTMREQLRQIIRESRALGHSAGETADAILDLLLREGVDVQPVNPDQPPEPVTP